MSQCLSIGSISKVLHVIIMLIIAANHSFRNNADYHSFHFHPVLGFIMAVVAVKDIPKGSEVRDTFYY